jgi:hypothetical protein
MSNYDPSELPTREITIGKKSRVLSYPLPSLWAFEDKTGLDLTAGVKVTDFGSGSKFTKNITALVWAGLLDSEPEITLESVGKMVHPRNFLYIQKAALEHLIESMKEPGDSPDPLAESPNVQASHPADSTSGQSAVTTSDSPTKPSVN